MKIYKLVPIAVLLIINASICAQTANEIVTKHINAIGGKDVVDQIKSQVVDATIDVMGSTLASKSTMLAGIGFRNEADFNGRAIIQVVTPTSGWMINPLQGITDPKPMPEDQFKAALSSLYPGDDLVNFKEKESTLELAGTEKLDGVNAFKIKLTGKDGSSSLFFIDPATYYILKRETTSKRNGEDFTGISIYSNYKKTDIGFVMPFTTIVNNGFDMTFNVTKVEFNNEIDPKIFEMPK